MPLRDIAYERLLRQRIAGERLKSPAEVVRWMGAVQAQDYAAAKWGVGLRTRGSTDDDLEAAVTNGDILRTHVMRPTWHFVSPDDIRWMLELTAPRVKALSATYYRQLELDDAVFKRSNALFRRALRDGKQLTRTELGSMLGKIGIATNNLRLAYIIMRAELDAAVCSGGRRGKQFTYALIDERAPNVRKLKREESLAELTDRYFTSHGPATVQDFVWWSGLSNVDANAGLEMVKSKLVCEVLEQKSYWLAPSAPAAQDAKGTVYLLPNYDEFVVGYADRSAVFDAAHTRKLDSRGSELVQHTIIVRGQIIGTWKRTVGKASVIVSRRPFIEPSKSQTRAIALAAKRFGEFLGLPVELA